jgi:hypothetical protein
MKMNLLATSLMLSMLKLANANAADKMMYNCDGWRNTRNETIPGTQVAIVSKDDGANLFVRTGPIVSHPKFQYEQMEFISRQNESLTYQTANYDVEILGADSSRARIQQKTAPIYANCEFVGRQR